LRDDLSSKCQVAVIEKEPSKIIISQQCR